MRKNFFFWTLNTGRRSELPEEAACRRTRRTRLSQAQLTTSLMSFTTNTSHGNRPWARLLVFCFHFGQSIAQSCKNLNLKTFRWTTRWSSLWYGQVTSWLLGSKLTSRKNNNQVKFCWKCDNNIFDLPYSYQCLETELNLEIDRIGHIHGPRWSAYRLVDELHELNFYLPYVSFFKLS